MYKNFKTTHSNNSSRAEKITKKFFFLITCVVIAILLTILAVLITKSIEFFSLVPVSNFLFHTEWDPQSSKHGNYGILPLLNGTILIVVIAIIASLPIGLMSAIYLSEFCSRKTRKFIKPFIELIAGIPTIVFGYFGVVFIAPVIKEIANHYNLIISLENALTAGIIMGIMIVPYIISLLDELFQTIPKCYKEASLALGSTPTETILHAILPIARQGIVAIIMLAVSRAIGETMIVTMAAGLTPNITLNPLNPVTTITSQIVTILSGDQEFSSPQTLAAFALATFLFLIIFFINTVAEKIINQYQKEF